MDERSTFVITEIVTKHRLLRKDVELKRHTYTIRPTSFIEFKGLVGDQLWDVIDSRFISSTPGKVHTDILMAVWNSLGKFSFKFKNEGITRELILEQII